jgi:hypothetical protein
MKFNKSSIFLSALATAGMVAVGALTLRPTISAAPMVPSITFFSHLEGPRTELTLAPDPNVRKELSQFPAPHTVVNVYVPLYPGATPIDPVPNIADLGTPMDADLVDGTLYFQSKQPPRVIQTWFAHRMAKLGYHQGGTSTLDNGQTLSTGVTFTRAGGVEGNPTRWPDVGLGFITTGEGTAKETLFKVRAQFIVVPQRPAYTRISHPVTSIVLHQTHKTVHVTEQAWIRAFVRRFNALEMSTPAISSGPAVASDVDETVTVDVYDHGTLVNQVKFLLPGIGVTVGKVTLNGSVTLEKALEEKLGS